MIERLGKELLLRGVGALHRNCRHSFSLEGEDLVLDELMGRPSKGFYADVGAHHPFRQSNTAIFYLRGWRGVNIDANPGAMKAFARHRTRDVNLEIAISDKRGERKFFSYSDGALNGIDNDRRDELAGSIYELKEITDVKTDTLASVLGGFNVLRNKVRRCEC